MSLSVLVKATVSTINYGLLKFLRGPNLKQRTNEGEENLFRWHCRVDSYEMGRN